MAHRAELSAIGRDLGSRPGWMFEDPLCDLREEIFERGESVMGFKLPDL